jgi:hypothetical protein
VKEELGLTVLGLRHVARLTVEDVRHDVGHPQRAFDLRVFATRTFAGEIAASSEIRAYRWVEADRLWGLPVTPRLPEVVAAALSVFDRS